MKIVPGSVVISKAGRDKNKSFIVLEVGANNEYILMADGKLRRVENPKRKKLKHIIVTDKVTEKLANKLSEGKPLQNAEIFKELSFLNETGKV